MGSAREVTRTKVDWSGGNAKWKTERGKFRGKSAGGKTGSEQRKSGDLGWEGATRGLGMAEQKGTASLAINTRSTKNNGMKRKRRKARSSGRDSRKPPRTGIKQKTPYRSEGEGCQGNGQGIGKGESLRASSTALKRTNNRSLLLFQRPRRLTPRIAGGTDKEYQENQIIERFQFFGKEG